MTGGLYIFLTASPFLLVESYGADPRHLGTYYGLIALGAGAIAASRLANRFPTRALMRTGTFLAVLGSGAFLLTAALGLNHGSVLTASMILLTIGGGLAIPTAMVSALAASPGRVGTAVSAYGALQMAGNAAATSVIASASPQNPVIVGAVIVAMAVCAAWLGLKREKGETL